MLIKAKWWHGIILCAKRHTHTALMWTCLHPSSAFVSHLLMLIDNTGLRLHVRKRKAWMKWHPSPPLPSSLPVLTHLTQSSLGTMTSLTPVSHKRRTGQRGQKDTQLHMLQQSSTKLTSQQVQWRCRHCQRDPCKTNCFLFIYSNIETKLTIIKSNAGIFIISNSFSAVWKQ